MARSLNAERDGYNDGSDQTYIPDVALCVNLGPGQRNNPSHDNMIITGPIMSDGKRMPGTQPDDAESLVVTPINMQAAAKCGVKSPNMLGIWQPGDPAYTLNTNDRHAIAITSEVSATIGTEHKGPGSRDDFHSIISEPIPILEAGARTGVSTTDPRAGIGIGESGDPMFTLQSGKQHAVAFQSSQSGVRLVETHATLDANNGSRRQNGVIVPTDPVAYRTSGNCGVMEQGDRTAALNTATDPNQNIVAFPEETKQVQWASGGGQVENPTAQALRSGAQHNYQFLRGGFRVRRLTPTECERLQNFPDCWTAFGVDEKGQQIPMSDSARYKMLGNAVTCSVSNWLATRIKQFLNKP